MRTDDVDLQTLSVCSGILGLEMGIRSVTGTRIVGYIENDLYCQQVIQARIADGWLTMKKVPK